MWPTFLLPLSGEYDLAGAKLVEVGAIGCLDSVLYYTPNTTTPLAQAGDLAVLVVVSDTEGSTQTTCTVSPDTFDHFFFGSTTYMPLYNGNSVFDVRYKILTEGDLSTTFSITHGSGVGVNNELCGRAYVFRNYNADIPLDCMSFAASSGDYDGSSSPPIALRIFGVHPTLYANYNGDYRISLMGADWSNSDASSTSLPPSYVKIAEDSTHEWSAKLKSTGAGRQRIFHVDLRRASEPLVNLFPNEDFEKPLTDWTGTALDTFDHGLTSLTSGTSARYANLVNNTVSTPHYAEIEVSLTAGQRYSWNTAFITDSSNYEAFAISVTPPSGSGNEFGFVGYCFNRKIGERPTGGTTYNDPQGGRDDWWYGGTTAPLADGLPDTTNGLASIYFEAQETGTHKFRIYCTYLYYWANLGDADTHSRRIRVTGSCLSEGWGSAIWLPSATENTALAKIGIGPTWYFTGTTEEFSTSEGLGMYSFTVNRGDAAIPPAVMVPHLGLWTEKLGWSADGLSSTDPRRYPSNNGRGMFICSRVVYPTIEGVTQAYYAEWTIDAITGSPTNRDGFYVGPTHSTFGDLENNAEEAYDWSGDGTFYAPSTVTAPTAASWATLQVGDVFGVLVDYTAAQVVFYKNGVAKGTFAMATTNRTHAELPFMLGLSTHVSGFLEWTANLTGPFSYQPVGSIAWDWPNTPA